MRLLTDVSKCLAATAKSVKTKVQSFDRSESKQYTFLEQAGQNAWQPVRKVSRHSQGPDQRDRKTALLFRQGAGFA